MLLPLFALSVALAFSPLLAVTSPLPSEPALDLFNIRNVISDAAIDIDNRQFTGLATLFTPNASLNLGPKIPVAHGVGAIQATVAGLLPPGTVTQNALSTQSIMLLPANDDDYGKGKSKATALTYVTTTYFGHGNLTGQTLALYGRFQDDLVKTKDVGHGGWRIDARVLTPFSTPVGNPVLLPPPPPPSS